MSLCIHGEAVDFRLHGKVLKVAEMIGIVFLDDHNHAARTRGIRTLQPWVELDYIGASW